MLRGFPKKTVVKMNKALEHELHSLDKNYPEYEPRKEYNDEDFKEPKK
ncbi:hypothetical protein [Methanosarcina sp. UBA5]|nr:hypothetical protein [Methanosarcina sp. UBA5]